jgi:1-acyl-sn-glycerol-3-phosphate acyltransferase
MHLTAADTVEWMRTHGGPETQPPGGRVEARATRTVVHGADPVRRAGRLLGWAEAAHEAGAGTLWVDRHHLGFTPAEGPEERWPLAGVRSVQVASRTLHIKAAKALPVNGFSLSDASPFRWGDLLHARIDTAHGDDRVLEILPRVVTAAQVAEVRARSPSRTGPRPVRPDGSPSRLPLYPTARAVLGAVLRVGLRLRVDGAERVPETGPCVLAANHQSILDAVVVQSVCPRPVRAMAKSTQFRGPLWSRLMPALGAFPVRRFDPDPQAVRTALRVLARGEVLGLYPEGERSWTGAVNPFRRGALRLLVSSGVPVVPVAVSGTYDVWPRWSRWPRRGTVRVAFGRPLRLPVLHTRPDREAAVATAGRRLANAFEALGLAMERRAADAPSDGGDAIPAGGHERGQGTS